MTLSQFEFTSDILSAYSRWLALAGSQLGNMVWGTKYKAESIVYEKMGDKGINPSFFFPFYPPLSCSSFQSSSIFIYSTILFISFYLSLSLFSLSIYFFKL